MLARDWAPRPRSPLSLMTSCSVHVLGSRRRFAASRARAVCTLRWVVASAAAATVVVAVTSRAERCVRTWRIEVPAGATSESNECATGRTGLDDARSIAWPSFVTSATHGHFVHACCSNWKLDGP